VFSVRYVLDCYYECQSAKGQWGARASGRDRRTRHVLSSNVALSNLRKTAVFHDDIAGRRYSQLLVRNVSAASDSVEWSATLERL
jgi:hypothetical protein